ncbi:MAG: adhesin [Leptospiraceae bacterium]|nr:MAG: adhesin [Leptospiraceae bacterium]
MKIQKFLLLLLVLSQSIYAQIKVVTTLTVLKYITQEIGKEKVNVESLIPGDVDPHFADARPDYILKLNQADLLVYIGMDLEIGWLPKLVEQSRNPKIYLGNPGNCDVSKGIHVLEKPSGKIDRSMGDIHIYGNPHYWLDPVNAVIIARNIKEHLVEIDPENKTFYNNNFKDFANKIKELTKQLLKQYNHLKGLKVAVYHREFIYFLNRFGLKEIVSLEEKPGVPPSASYLKKVIDKIKKEKIKIILIAPYNNPKYANFVANETGSKVVIIPTNLNHSITTYEDLLKTILQKISENI